MILATSDETLTLSFLIFQHFVIAKTQETKGKDSSMASKDLILTFLGTGAMKPSFRRGSKKWCYCNTNFVASTVGMLIPTKRGSEDWLFDCGEGELYSVFPLCCRYI